MRGVLSPLLSMQSQWSFEDFVKLQPETSEVDNNGRVGVGCQQDFDMEENELLDQFYVNEEVGNIEGDEDVDEFVEETKESKINYGEKIHNINSEDLNAMIEIIQVMMPNEETEKVVLSLYKTLPEVKASVDSRKKNKMMQRRDIYLAKRGVPQSIAKQKMRPALGMRILQVKDYSYLKVQNFPPISFRNWPKYGPTHPYYDIAPLAIPEQTSDEFWPWQQKRLVASIYCFHGYAIEPFRQIVKDKTCFISHAKYRSVIIRVLREAINNIGEFMTLSIMKSDRHCWSGIDINALFYKLINMRKDFSESFFQSFCKVIRLAYFLKSQLPTAQEIVVDIYQAIAKKGAEIVRKKDLQAVQLKKQGKSLNFYDKPINYYKVDPKQAVAKVVNLAKKEENVNRPKKIDPWPAQLDHFLMSKYLQSQNFIYIHSQFQSKVPAEQFCLFYSREQLKARANLLFRGTISNLLNPMLLKLSNNQSNIVVNEEQIDQIVNSKSQLELRMKLCQMFLNPTTIMTSMLHGCYEKLLRMREHRRDELKKPSRANFNVNQLSDSSSGDEEEEKQELMLIRAAEKEAANVNVNVGKRRRGRPKGSLNRKTDRKDRNS